MLSIFSRFCYNWIWKRNCFLNKRSKCRTNPLCKRVSPSSSIEIVFSTRLFLIKPLKNLLPVSIHPRSCRTSCSVSGSVSAPFDYAEAFSVGDASVSVLDAAAALLTLGFAHDWTHFWTCSSRNDTPSHSESIVVKGLEGELVFSLLGGWQLIQQKT